LKNFVRVEAMPRHALEQGVPWGWHSYRDYLNRIEGRLGINVGGLVGHIAVRQYVMGEESVERQATPAEIQRMKALVLEGMEAGALGFSTNRNERHMREDGKPVPSRLASDEELFTLCDVLGEVNAGAFQSTLGQFTPKHFELYNYLARRTQRPVIGQTVMYRPNAPKRWKEQLDAVMPTFRDGYRLYLRTHTVPNFRTFTLSNTQAFDEFPKWKQLMFMEIEARKKSGKTCAPIWPIRGRRIFIGAGILSPSKRQPNLKTRNTLAKAWRRWRRCAVRITSMRSSISLWRRTSKYHFATPMRAAILKRCAKYCRIPMFWWAIRMPEPMCSTTRSSATARRFWGFGRASAAS
jgi:hypothetical protein